MLTISYAYPNLWAGVVPGDVFRAEGEPACKPIAPQNVHALVRCRVTLPPGALRQEVADFSLLFPLLPLTDYDFTGNRKFPRRCWPAVQGIEAAFARYRRHDGLLETTGRFCGSPCADTRSALQKTERRLT